MAILKVLVTDEADVTSFENEITVCAPRLKMPDCHQRDLFVRKEKIENLDTTLCVVILFHVSYLHALFCM